MLWLDCDREGENTAFEVVDVCRAVKHNMYIRRTHFSALIDRLKNAKTRYFLLYVLTLH